MPDWTVYFALQMPGEQKKKEYPINVDDADSMYEAVEKAEAIWKEVTQPHESRVVERITAPKGTQTHTIAPHSDQTTTKK